MKILFITTYFSTTNPNCLCIKAVADEFSKRGYQCKILTRYGVSFDSKISNQYIDHEGGSAHWNNKFLARTQIALSYFSWPAVVFSGINSLYKKAVVEMESDMFDVIICYCNPSDSLLVGSRLKKRYGNKIKYYAYFLDSILSGPIPTMLTSKQHDRKSLRFERKVLENADGVIMMEAAKKKYLDFQSQISFFDKIVFLDLPLYNPYNKNDEAERKYFPSEQKVLLFAGTMPKNIRDPRFFLDVFSRIADRSVHLYLVGKSDFMEDIQRYSHCNIHFLGLLPHYKIIEMIREADLLLNIGNSIKGMVPSKIFEYMSTGKPIVSTIKIKDDPSLMYFLYYGNSLLLDEKGTVLDASAKLEKFIRQARSIQVNDCNGADKLFNNTPVAFVNHIEELYFA